MTRRETFGSFFSGVFAPLLSLAKPAQAQPDGITSWQWVYEAGLLIVRYSGPLKDESILLAASRVRRKQGRRVRRIILPNSGVLSLLDRTTQHFVQSGTFALQEARRDYTDGLVIVAPGLRADVTVGSNVPDGMFLAYYGPDVPKARAWNVGVTKEKSDMT